MIKHNRLTLGQEEVDAAGNSIQSGWLAQGEEVHHFENEVCEFLGLPQGHAVALSSGTASLYLALWSLEAQHKTVTLPVYSCSALRNAVCLVGAAEYLIDTEIESPNVCLSSLEHSRADIAIIPHMFGIPSNLGAIEKIDIIEDCAQSIGALVNKVRVGLQGKLGVFSFFATKLITSGGQGGMVVSGDSKLIDAIRDYREFDYRNDGQCRFNFQMTDMQAAIGRVQLRKLPYFLQQRSDIFEQYQSAGLPLLDSDIGGSVRYRAIIQTDRAVHIKNELLQRHIQTIVPIEDRELLDRDWIVYKNAYNWTQNTLSLPIYPSLSKDEVAYIISSLKEVI